MDSSSSGKRRKRRKRSSGERSGMERSRSRAKEAKAPKISVTSSLRSRLTPSGKARPLRFKEKALLYVIALVCLGASLTTLFVWKSRTTPNLEWSDLTQLPEVKPAPASVSSEADPTSPAYIEPFLCRGNTEYAIEKIEEILRSDPNITHVRRNENQVMAVAVTPLIGFKDDLIFQTREDPSRVEIYSASRVGSGDFGANRKRMEEMRELLRQLRVVK